MSGAAGRPGRPPLDGMLITMRSVASLLLAVAAASACAGSGGPRLVSYPQPGARPVTNIELIEDYRTAVASVIAATARELGRAPFPVTFHLYPNRDAFEAALVQVGHGPSFARTTAQTMMAVGGHRNVLLNEAALTRREWPDRTMLLAHELGHSVQYELGGGVRGTSDQWLREGFAEWLSVRVLDRLGGISVHAFRRQRIADLHARGRAAVPRLDQMVTFRQWVEIGARQGAAAYALAFFGAELLIERHGVAAVLDYFSRFAVSQDRLGHFRAAFGESIEDFEAALTARLWGR